MTFFYRLPAIFTASFASCALGLLAISGITCQFTEIRSKDGHLLYIPNTSEPPINSITYVGVICGSPLYDHVLEDSLMFLLSRICLFAAIAMGSFTCVLAWSISTFVHPTEANWKLLSVFAAIAAVLQMPVFLIFETEPCAAYGSEQDCYLSDGSFYLILSSAFWVAVTVATQFLDPPRWAEEHNAWRFKPNKEQQHNNVLNGPVRNSEVVADVESQAPSLKTPPRNSKRAPRGSHEWTQQKRWATSAELPKNQTDSLSLEEEQVEENQIFSYCGDMNNISGLILNVLPNGRRPGDDSKSVRSFDDLDSFVRMVEEGKLPETKSLAPPSRNASFATTEAEVTADEIESRQLVVYQGEQKSQIVRENDNRYCEQRRTSVIQTSDAKPDQYELQSSTCQVVTTKERSPEKHNKSSNLIKNLTENLKLKSRARRVQSNKYSLLDDDDMELSLPILPTEVFIHENERESLPDSPLAPAKEPEFPLFDSHVLDATFDGDQYPDPIISYMESHEEPSSEDESDPNSSSFIHEIDERSEEDTVDVVSIQSTSSSESSSSDENQRRPFSRNQHRVRRTGSLGCSVRSVLSSTSLLDTMIAEETDADLIELEESAAPYNLVRSKSAPIQHYRSNAAQNLFEQDKLELHDHASVSMLGSNLFPPTNNMIVHESDDHKELYKIQLAPIPFCSRSLHSDCERSIGQSIGSVDPSNQYGNRLGSSASATALTLSLDTEEEDPVDSVSFFSGLPTDLSPQSNLEDGNFTATEVTTVREGKPDPDGTAPAHGDSNTGKAKPEISVISCKISTPASPALTAPMTPSPVQAAFSGTSFHAEEGIHDLSASFESERNWKEEREFRGGIHATPLELDESSVHNDEEKTLSASDVVREARIRRLQRQTDALKRTRSRTQDPTPRRRPSPTTFAHSSVIDSLDLQLIELMREPHMEYGPDESSL